jgi:hypothetical protein
MLVALRKDDPDTFGDVPKSYANAIAEGLDWDGWVWEAWSTINADYRGFGPEWEDLVDQIRTRSD